MNIINSLSTLKSLPRFLTRTFLAVTVLSFLLPVAHWQSSSVDASPGSITSNKTSARQLISNYSGLITNQTVVTDVRYRIIDSQTGGTKTIAMEVTINPLVVSLGQGAIPSKGYYIFAETGYDQTSAANRFQNGYATTDLFMPAPSTAFSSPTPNHPAFVAYVSEQGLIFQSALASLSSQPKALWDQASDTVETYFEQLVQVDSPKPAIKSVASISLSLSNTAWAQEHGDGSFDFDNILVNTGAYAAGGFGAGLLPAGLTGGLTPIGGAVTGGLAAFIGTTCLETWDVIGDPVCDFFEAPLGTSGGGFQPTTCVCGTGGVPGGACCNCGLPYN